MSLRRLSARARTALGAATGAGVLAGVWASNAFYKPANVPDMHKAHVIDTSKVDQLKAPEVHQCPLPYLSDSVFENTDDLAVFMFASEAMCSAQLPFVKQLIAQFNQERAKFSNLAPVHLMHCIVPPVHAAQEIPEDRVEVMCYKGQRKERISIKEGDVDWLSKWDEFFKPKYTSVSPELKNDVIRHVSGFEFANEISSSKPKLFQLYENSCFLCFLMRPFLNSVSLVLKDLVPFEFVRLDIEDNDFPKGLPVVRGTPTFVFFKNGDGERWKAFKPRDLINKLCAEYTVPASIEKELFRLVDRMALRFQAFSGLVMWTTEATKLTDMLAGTPTEEKDTFNQTVSEMMIEDMSKTDTLDENLAELFSELGQAEMHAIMLAQILGQKVLDKEQI